VKKTINIDSALHRRLAIVARNCDQTIEEIATVGIEREVARAERRTKEKLE
jgi:predicted transcriptional regulator